MKYPIGIQDFRTLREGDYVYVDKTRQIHQLVSSGAYYFLSRPRRFGKSLTVSTIKEMYSGAEDLFSGLWVEDKWDFIEMRRPVVWLRFAQSGFRTEGLEAALHRLINQSANELGVELTETAFDQRFGELLRKASGKGRVVLLIDEYDKPIIDYIDDINRANRNRELLKSFYSVIKDSGPYLQLVFITGVSAFGKVSIFSDLNNLENITLAPYAETLVGITQNELQKYFGPHLKSRDNDELRKWYNGYSWGGKVKLYNPFSLLSHFKSGSFQAFWYETGTPSFLLKALRERGQFNVRGIQAYRTRLLSFDVSALDPIGLLFQTGYLTIIDVEEQDSLYRLDFPNLEVRQSLEGGLLDNYLHLPPDESHCGSTSGQRRGPGRHHHQCRTGQYTL